MKYRILLVDDHEAFRFGVRTKLEQQPDIEMIGEAATVPEAIELALAEPPDVLVLDMQIPGSGERDDGVTVARRLRREGLTVPILVLSDHDDEGYVLSMLAEEVAGYFLKTESLEQITHAVRGIARGESGWFSRPILATVTRSRRKGQELTPREFEVLPHLHLSNEALAKELGIRYSTARKHVSNILGKLSVTSRAAAIDKAWRTGLLVK